LCWEHAVQLRDSVLPSSRVYFVGVGTAEAALEFATQLEIDASLCLGDENGVAGDALSLNKGFNTMWNPPVVQAMMDRNDEESLKALGESFKGAVDNIGIRQLAPAKIADTLRQGGTFVFKGDQLLLEHYDEKVGDTCPVEDVLAAIKKK